MQVPTPHADARELRSTRRAYRERRRAAPTTDPRVLALACASHRPAHVGMEHGSRGETAKWIVELVWNGYTVVLVVDSMGL
jgi:hypothetical protein